MTLAYLGLGSNLGDRREYLRHAVTRLSEASEKSVRMSRVFETDPVGGPDNQGPYLNMVAELDTALSVDELLAFCQELEHEAARERIIRWGPRTLDVDVLLYAGVTQDDEHLTVPHPRMWQRRFVLEPLGDLAPELLPPDWQDHLEPGRVWPVEDL